MSADSAEGNCNEWVEPGGPNDIINTYRPDDGEAESIHESSDGSIKNIYTFNAEVATITNSHDLEVMEEYKEEPGSGEGRVEIDNVTFELDANTPDVGSAVTAECHSERELSV